MSTICSSFQCVAEKSLFSFSVPQCQMCREKRAQSAAAAANSSSAAAAAMPSLERIPPPSYTSLFGSPPSAAPARRSKRVAVKAKAKVEAKVEAPPAAAAAPLRATAPSSDTQLAVMQARYEELSNSNARYDQLVQTVLSALSPESLQKKRKLR